MVSLLSGYYIEVRRRLDSVNAYDGLAYPRLSSFAGQRAERRLRSLQGERTCRLIRQKFGWLTSCLRINLRLDESLIAECVSVVSTLEGIKAQFAMAINKNVDDQNYFDKATRNKRDGH